MKGVIFRGLESLVIEKCGMAAWESLLEKNAPDDRVYISAKSYPDEELVGLAQDVAVALSLPLQDVLKAFGEYLFGYLLQKHPTIVDTFDGFSSLIMGIDSVIHVEVAKLYQEPNLPKIECELVREGFILMQYYSKRKLCLCAEGLIYGAAAHYSIDVTLDHVECMHQGADACVIEVRYESTNI
ncbi:heme NO-binding domain-containing protein [Pseudoalteromonas sp. MMG012]|uniref:heme NO-binding domain-containing protein n=1 Tax=Pseudoalteromonas sp. MMG012 TaxID=2822686 RepID=UPI001B39F463|nr:heme NO-binding domain-containing protein [Pseudoalteromonas sp. MMG012]MBQ4850195.1 heme NO-binding domain-containing protein [Pseudoalteromonas sp. MMG012]